MSDKSKKKHVRHVPQRTCIACRQTLPKRSLIRLVRTDEGLQLDPTGKVSGRGAYLHDSKACWNIAIQHRLLEKSLKTELNDKDLEKMRLWMEDLPDNAE